MFRDVLGEATWLGGGRRVRALGETWRAQYTRGVFAHWQGASSESSQGPRGIPDRGVEVYGRGSESRRGGFKDVVDAKESASLSPR